MNEHRETGPRPGGHHPFVLLLDYLLLHVEPTPGHLSLCESPKVHSHSYIITLHSDTGLLHTFTTITAVPGASKSSCSACVGPEQDFRADKQNFRKRREESKQKQERPAQDHALRELACNRKFGSFGPAVGKGTWSQKPHPNPKPRRTPLILGLLHQCPRCSPRNKPPDLDAAGHGAKRLKLPICVTLPVRLRVGQRKAAPRSPRLLAQLVARHPAAG